MATGTALDSQVGYKAETTWNTAVVVDRFLPLVSETMKKEIAPIDAADIITGRQVQTSQQWAQGNASVGGDIQHELYVDATGLLLRAAFGTVNTAAAGGTGVHTFWPANPSVSLTCQVGRPLVYGTVQPYTYSGCKVASWELAGAAGEFFTWGMSLVGAEEFMGTALASASFSANVKRWSFRHAVITVDGTTVPVKSYRIAGDNKLAERRFLGSTIISEPLREDLAEYTGEFVAEWGNPSGAGTNVYARYREGAESTLIATMTQGTNFATLAANVRYEGTTPNVGGRGIIEHPVPFKAVASGSLDEHAVKVTWTNNDSTA